MAGKPKHNAVEIFDKYIVFIKNGFGRREAAKKCGVSHTFPDRSFTAIQKAEIDQVYHVRSFKNMFNKSKKGKRDENNL